MYRARHALLHERPTALSRALAFLVKDYEPQYFWWELIEAWKKLFLVGFMVLIKPDTIEQIMIAFGFMLAYLLVFSQARPFRTDSDDFFAKALTLLPCAELRSSHSLARARFISTRVTLAHTLCLIISRL